MPQMLDQLLLRSCISIHRRLSQCPRFRRHPAVLARLSWSRRRRSSWWWCRLLCLVPLCSRLPSRPLTFQFLALGVFMEVHKVFTQDRVQQRRFLSSSLTFLLVEVFKGFSQDRCQPRHPHCLALQMRPLKGGVVFALFRVRVCLRTRAHGRLRLFEVPSGSGVSVQDFFYVKGDSRILKWFLSCSLAL